MTLFLLILLATLILISYVFTVIIRKIALRTNVMDIPNERSSHSVPTPRGGGLAIVITWYIGITFLFFAHHLDEKLYYALFSGIILAFISLLDDLISLKPIIRLSVQIITAIIALRFLDGMQPVSIHGIGISSGLLLYPLSLIGIVWFINLYNFLDGIDAYASVETIFIAAGMFIFTRNPVMLILIASVSGFLVLNWPKARIFMGDVGSTQLGFILIILGIYFHNHGDFNIIYWVMLSSLFWFDASFTLFRRWRNREKLSVAHRKHAYQRIVQAGFSHAKTVYFSILINLIILSLIILAHLLNYLLFPLLLLNILFLYWVTRLVDGKKAFR